jgi:hypothetical protein
MTITVQHLKFTSFLLKKQVQCLQMTGSHHMSQFYANSKLELSLYIYNDYYYFSFLKHTS